MMETIFGGWHALLAIIFAQWGFGYLHAVFLADRWPMVSIWKGSGLILAILSGAGFLTLFLHLHYSLGPSPVF